MGPKRIQIPNPSIIKSNQGESTSTFFCFVCKYLNEFEYSPSDLNTIISIKCFHCEKTQRVSVKEKISQNENILIKQKKKIPEITYTKPQKDLGQTRHELISYNYESLKSKRCIMLLKFIAYFTAGMTLLFLLTEIFGELNEFHFVITFILLWPAKKLIEKGRNFFFGVFWPESIDENGDYLGNEDFKWSNVLTVVFWLICIPTILMLILMI